MNWIDYKDIRCVIQTGDIYFTGSNTIVSRIIKYFTKSDISHVGMFVVIGERIFVVELKGDDTCKMIPASTKFEKEKLIYCPTYKELDIDTVIGDVGRIKYNLFGAIVSPFYRTNRARKNCAEWTALKLGLPFEHLKRGLYPIDLLNRFI